MATPPISTSTPPPFQVYPPFLAKNFEPPPSPPKWLNFWKVLSPTFNKGGFQLWGRGGGGFWFGTIKLMENSELSFPKNNKQHPLSHPHPLFIGRLKFLKSHVPFPCKNRGEGGDYSFSFIMYGFSNSLLSRSFI